MKKKSVLVGDEYIAFRAVETRRNARVHTVPVAASPPPPGLDADDLSPHTMDQPARNALVPGAADVLVF